jgi:hypothetical protein
VATFVKQVTSGRLSLRQGSLERVDDIGIGIGTGFGLPI